MGGGKIKQRENGRMEVVYIYSAHIAVIMDQPTHYFVLRIILSPRFAVCPETECRDSGSWVVV